MKALFLSLVLTLVSVSSLASSGKIEVITNDDESIMVVTGEAAKDLYNRLDLPSEEGWKQGRDLSCKKTSDKAYRCIMGLEESNSSDVKFTGVVGK